MIYKCVKKVLIIKLKYFIIYLGDGNEKNE